MNDAKQMQAAYARAFATADGKVVLNDLIRRFYDGPMDGPDVNRELGQRDVVRHIQLMVKRNERD